MIWSWERRRSGRAAPSGRTGGQLILCSSPAPDAVYLKTVKKSMGLACVRPGDTAGVLERLAPVFPQLCPAANVLETSLNNSNPISHGPLALFNITRMENGEDFLLFGTGVTPRVARFMEKIDRERVAVGPRLRRVRPHRAGDAQFLLAGAPGEPVQCAA